MFRYFIAHKPYNVICQFTPDVEGQKTLSDLDFTFPKDAYAIGRLDLDSEGMLLLSNDGSLNHRLLNPKFAHERTYLVQVEDNITDEAINLMQSGVDIKIDKKIYHTLPCKVARVEDPSVFFDGKTIEQRDPPAKASGGKPTSWIAVTLTEGKNRQVRRMCAKVLHPCLRLIRVRMQDLAMGNLAINQVIELERDFVYQKLGIGAYS